MLMSVFCHRGLFQVQCLSLMAFIWFRSEINLAKKNYKKIKMKKKESNNIKMNKIKQKQKQKQQNKINKK